MPCQDSAHDSVCRKFKEEDMPQTQRKDARSIEPVEPYRPNDDFFGVLAALARDANDQPDCERRQLEAIFKQR